MAESATVTLLPLIQETAAQREGEPSTVTPRTYQGSDRIGPLRLRCRCTEIEKRGSGGCTPAFEATRLHNLPWSYSVNLTAISDREFWSRLLYFDRTALTALDSLSTGLLTDPVYILSIICPTPVRYRPRSGYHAHLLVANLDWSELGSLLSAWGPVPPQSIIRADRLPSTPWKALHYTLSNDPRTGATEIDSLPNLRHLPLRHLVDQGMGNGHVDGSPVYSPTLEAVITRWRQLRRSRLSPSRYGAGRRNQPSRSRAARRKERERLRLRNRQPINQRRSS